MTCISAIRPMYFFLSLDRCIFFSDYFQSLAILLILMIASEKSHQNLSDDIQFLLKKDLNLKKGGIIFREKIIDSGN